MPQEFHVLQCYSCESFQVHIVKKVAKWSCKMCGEKQSVKKVFGRGNGKDCRLHVQELNERRIKKDESVDPEEDTYDHTILENSDEYTGIKGESKWAEFLKNHEEEDAFQSNIDKSFLDNKNEILTTREKCFDGSESIKKKIRVSNWAEFDDLESKDEVQIKASDEKIKKCAEKPGKDHSAFSFFEPNCSNLDSVLDM